MTTTAPEKQYGYQYRPPSKYRAAITTLALIVAVAALAAGVQAWQRWTQRAPYGPDAVDRPRGAGRPAKVFALTTAGRDAFEQQYDDLAVQALRYLADTAGDDAVDAFARRRVADLEGKYAATLDAAGPQERPRLLVEVLNGEGYAASLVDGPGGPAVQLCQHHCPVSHVAAEFPALCEAETEAFSRLLGTHVTRLATLAHGDGVCTTLVPLPNPARQEVSS